MTYALFKHGKQESKAHSTREAVAIEAYERKLVTSSSADFPSDVAGRYLGVGYEIREIKS